MSQTTYLLRANNATDFNAMVKYLRCNDHNWIDGTTTFDEVRSRYDKRKVILLRGMYNGITKRYEIQITYLSQFNKMMNILGLPIRRMKEVQTVIPLEFYK